MPSPALASSAANASPVLGRSSGGCAADYVDVMSFKRYQYTCLELVPPEGVDVPLMVGEWHIDLRSK